MAATPTAASAQPPQMCFLNYDEGPVSGLIHNLVEPLAGPNASTVHGVSCVVREQLGL